jgi:hypothetical protein
MGSARAGVAAPEGGSAPDVEAGGRATDAALRLSLEEERDFCLRSLRDLEAERDAGDIDAVDYETLRDAYTVRAAAALRQLAGDTAVAGVRGVPSGRAGVPVGYAEIAVSGQTGQDHEWDLDGLTDGDDGAPDLGPGRLAEGPSGRSRRALAGWRKRTLIAIGVLAVAGGAAWSVVASSATRLPGDEITGQALGAEAETQLLQQAQQAADKGDDVSAIKDYQKVLTDDPNQAEALTGEGWLLAQTQQPALLQQGLTMLLEAEQAAPTYAPAHVYRGISLLSEGDYSDAIPELRWYLAHSPDPQLAPGVRSALQQAEAKAAASKS